MSIRSLTCERKTYPSHMCSLPLRCWHSPDPKVLPERFKDNLWVMHKQALNTCWSPTTPKISRPFKGPLAKLPKFEEEAWKEILVYNNMRFWLAPVFWAGGFQREVERNPSAPDSTGGWRCPSALCERHWSHLSRACMSDNLLLKPQKD